MNDTKKLFIFDRELLEAKQYWINNTAGWLENITPIFGGRSPGAGLVKDTKIEFVIEGETYQALLKLTGNGPLLIYTTLLACLNVCFYKYSRTTTFALGSPARTEHEKNALLILNEISSDLSFRQILMNVSETLKQAYQHQSYPWERLKSDLGMETNEKTYPLFEAAMISRELHGELPPVNNFLTFVYARNPEGIQGEVLFAREQFTPEEVQEISQHMLNVLKQGLHDTTLTAANFNLLNEKDSHKILRTWNDTDVARNESRPVYNVIRDNALKNPENTAILFKDRSLNYADLNKRANQLAHYLRKQGAGPDVPVALLLERSVDLYVTYLATLKADAAFVPLDPAYPKDRLNYMLQDSGARLLLTQETLLTEIDTDEIHTVNLDRESVTIGAESQTDPEPEYHPENLAYIIYTSGSTGKPKGTLVTHRGLNNLAREQIKRFNIRPESRILQFASVSFDASVFDILMAFCSGAALCSGEPRQLQPGPALLELINQQKITHITFTPSLLAVLSPEDLPGLENIVVAGETCPNDLPALWAQGRRFFNAYGPTETTIWATVLPWDEPRKNVNIGRPIANTRIYILDRDLLPVPVGIPGELYIGGIGLARGYTNRPDLTAEKYIPDPFTPGERLYKTGDRARYLPDGEIEFLGRIGRQIKLRGYRIEPGEIENRLREHPSVREAVVFVDEKQNALIACVTPEIENEKVLREHLEKFLPDYMLPSTFVSLNKMPLTSAGKLDQTALPRPRTEQATPEKNRVLPQDQIEAKIAEVWGRLLNLEQVGLRDNFFEIGGHSLLLVKVQGELSRIFQAKINITSLFEFPTVRTLAEFIRDETGAAPDTLAPTESRETRNTAVAIIGMAGRFPDAANIDEFWRNLRDGVESIKFFTKAELKDNVPPELLNHPDYVRAWGLLNDTDEFDAEFFQIPPREAQMTDPQQRIFLETCHQTLEHAGYDPARYPGDIGVYAGGDRNTYDSNILSKSELAFDPNLIQTMIGNASDFLSSRVSYKLNLTGPALNIQSACSTSLVALHSAYRALLNGECDMALAGGASVLSPNKSGYMYQPDGILSPDGHCRAFDAESAGCVGGNGVGVVLLKRLDEALADGDSVHALIKGAAVNNDGSQKVAFSAPGIQGQAKAIRKALNIATVDPESISYIETHGTGTRLGDPVEVIALSRAFGETSRKKYCAIGSVKSNIGHLNSAAGIAGLIKTTMALKHKQIPPSLNFNSPNTTIDFSNSPFYVNTKLRDWDVADQPRRAGVSSFGIGGTNAHVILEEAPPPVESGPSRPHQLLCLSARDNQALEQLSTNLQNHMKQNPARNLADTAYTLSLGRAQFLKRRIIAWRQGETIDRAFNNAYDATAPSQERPVVLLFPGQGVQYPNMGLGLYRGERVFREELDRCFEILTPLLGENPRNIIFPEDVNITQATARLNQVEFAQPLLFSIEYATARLLQSCGIHISAMLGHSLGEYTAACLAGVFSPEDGLFLTATRGKLMGEIPPGGNTSVFATENVIRPHLNGGLSISTYAPGLHVVSGGLEALRAFETEMGEQEIEFRRLNVPNAAHCELTRLIQEPYKAKIKHIQFRPPQIPLLSNLTGDWMSDAEATDPARWSQHLCEPVQLTKGLGKLLEKQSAAFIEAGPGRGLSGFGQQHPEYTENHIFESTIRSAAQREKAPEIDESYIMSQTLGKLWARGVSVNWEQYYRGEKRGRVPLPTYPFQRKSFRIAPPVPSLQRRPTPRAQTAPTALRTPLWKETQSPESGPPDNGIPIFFTSSKGESAALLAECKRAGREFIQVKDGKNFKKLERNIFEINFARSEDYAKLIGELKSNPIKLIYTRSLAPLSTSETGYLSELLFITRALERQNRRASLQIFSYGALELSGAEVLKEEGAMIAGALEYLNVQPGITNCVLVDFSGEDAVLNSRTTNQILNEVNHISDESSVAYRGNRRWARSLAPSQHKQQALSEKDGVCLILGDATKVRHITKTLKPILKSPPLPLLEQSDPTLLKQINPDPEREVERYARIEREIKNEQNIIPLNSIPGLMQNLDDICANLVYEYFQRNLDVSPGAAYIRREFKRQLRLLDKFDKYLDFFLRIAREDGFIKLEGETIEFLKNPREGQNHFTLKSRTLQKHPEFENVIDFLEICARSYDESLSGLKETAEVLRPEGDDSFALHKLEEIYNHDSGKIYLAMARDVIADLVRRADGRKIRILEFGAGSGGFTWPMLETLKAANVDYHFTDIGRLFVTEAAEEAQRRGYTSMRFSRFDITADPATQEVDLAGYDLIVGYNVAQVGRDLRQNLKNLSELLKPGGLMLQVQLFRVERWHHIIFGLQPGWWDYADDLRKDSLIIDHQQWEEIIRGGDFDRVRIFPVSEIERKQLDHGLVLARKSETDEGLRSVNLADTREFSYTLSEIQKSGEAVTGVIYAPGSSQTWTAPATLEERLQSHSRKLQNLKKIFETHPPEFFLLLNEAISESMTTTDSGASDVIADFARVGLSDAFVSLENRNDGARWISARLKQETGKISAELLSELYSNPGPLAVVSGEQPTPTPRPEQTTRIKQKEAGAPSESLETKVNKLWQRSLGIQKIGREDDFFALGGDSLTAVHLLARLRESLGYPVKMGDFIENPTIAHMTKLLREEAGQSTPRTDGGKNDLRCLIPIQTNGNQTPLFCVHPVGGSPLCYMNLSRHLGTEQPLYGFQSPGLLDDFKTPTSIEEMAALYIGEMQTLQPEGPYQLGGWSGGGVIAYEMARQLNRQNQRVDLLAMFDAGLENVDGGQKGNSILGVASALKDATQHFFTTRPPTSWDELTMFGQWLGINLPDSVDSFLKKDFISMLGYGRDLALEIPRLIPVYKTNFMAILNYIPGPYQGQVIVFRAIQDEPGQDDPAVKSFQTLARGGLVIRRVPGNHMTLLDKNNSKFLAQSLSEFLTGPTTR